MMAALLRVPCSPTSQSTATSRSASLARHQLSATTATKVPRFNTLTIPLRFSTLDASMVLMVPLNTGQAAMAACSMPGTCASIPYFTRPVTMSGMSTRGMDLPINVQVFGVLELDVFGGFQLGRCSRQLAVAERHACWAQWVTLLSAALHSLAGTPHCWAAAAISISRPVAPALRRYSCELRMVRLPTEAMSP